MERITYDKKYNGRAREVHEYRYKLIGKYTKDLDRVLDVASGNGYGHKFLKGSYVGVDKESLCGNIVADLNTWKPEFAFDVGVCFETLEHLDNYQNLVEVLKQANRLVAYSAPIVPTVGKNKYHKQDFTYEQLKDLFKNWGNIIYEEKQNNLYGIFIVKKYE